MDQEHEVILEFKEEERFYSKYTEKRSSIFVFSYLLNLYIWQVYQLQPVIFSADRKPFCMF